MMCGRFSLTRWIPTVTTCTVRSDIKTVYILFPQYAPYDSEYSTVILVSDINQLFCVMEKQCVCFQTEIEYWAILKPNGYCMYYQA
jgi:hypothetical protein